MSALSVSRHCYEKYLPISKLPDSYRDDIKLLAGYFHARGQFVNVFINDLVPWDDLAGEPNPGHAAVADFLVCRAATAALSANFDELIEQWAAQRKVAMRGALDGNEAVRFSTATSPLLKFHGCMKRGRETTLWTPRQLTDLEVSRRIRSCADWMRTNLPDRDLLIIGFWTDWAYLNDVLAEALSTVHPGSVTVIDKASRAELAERAPRLWTELSRLGFVHLQESSAEALEQLRVEFSKAWTRKLYAFGKPLLEAELGSACPPALVEPPDLDSNAYYDLRRDAEGIPYNRAARQNEPHDETAQTALAHFLLLKAGATRVGPWYRIAGKTVRVIHGAGQGITTVQAKYVEPPSIEEADFVICAGALDTGTPGRIIAPGRAASVAHPGPGGASRWLTLENARTELGL
jgi:hypothetical protein